MHGGRLVTLWRAEDAHVSRLPPPSPAISAWLSSRTPRAAAAAARHGVIQRVSQLTSLEPPPLPLPPAALALRRAGRANADRVVPF